MLLILSNIYFAKNKLNAEQLVVAVVFGLVAFVNAIFIVAVVCLAWKMAAAEVKK